MEAHLSFPWWPQIFDDLFFPLRDSNQTYSLKMIGCADFTNVVNHLNQGVPFTTHQLVSLCLCVE